MLITWTRMGSFQFPLSDKEQGVRMITIFAEISIEPGGTFAHETIYSINTLPTVVARIRIAIVDVCKHNINLHFQARIKYLVGQKDPGLSEV